MKSRRRIAYPSGFQLRPSEQEIATSEMGSVRQCALQNPNPPMSVMGQKRRLPHRETGVHSASIS
jgi:hypothetical protein